MKRSQLMCLVVLVIVSMLAPAWWALAAPILPAQSSISDEVLSLSQIREVRLEVDPLPKELIDAGARDTSYTKLVHDVLEDAGFEIVDDETLPVLVNRVIIAKDADHPNTLAIHQVIAVRQSVLVDRLGRHLTVPTATISDVELSTRSRAAKTLEDVVGKNVRVLASAVEMATK